MKCIPLLTAAQVGSFREALANASFASGAATAGAAALLGVKQNLQVRPVDDVHVAMPSNNIEQALRLNRHVAVYANIERMTPVMFARYDVGHAYGPHIDAAVIGGVRADLAVTVALTDDYEGGELRVGGQIKLAAGECLVYPADTIHSVAPVTRGTRLVALTWIQTRVRDPRQRELLVELEEASQRTRDMGVRLCYQNLLRMWAECE